MHAKEREQMILTLLRECGFQSLKDLSVSIQTSRATIRRDLARMSKSGHLVRVRGGAQLSMDERKFCLCGNPFLENICKCRAEKERIGKAAADLCSVGDAVIIDGGTTTLQMCPHLEPLELQVLTNSIRVVSALLTQPRTQIAIPGGVLFREQNVILDPLNSISPQSFHATRLFIGGSAVTRFGLMQCDIILAQAEQNFLNLADEVVVLVDSSKFRVSTGHVVCNLSRIQTLITDDKLSECAADMIRDAGIRLITVSP